MHEPYIVYDYSIRIVIQSSIGPNDEPGKQAGRRTDGLVWAGWSNLNLIKEYILLCYKVIHV